MQQLEIHTIEATLLCSSGHLIGESKKKELKIGRSASFTDVLNLKTGHFVLFQNLQVNIAITNCFLPDMVAALARYFPCIHFQINDGYEKFLQYSAWTILEFNVDCGFRTWVVILVYKMFCFWL